MRSRISVWWFALKSHLNLGLPGWSILALLVTLPLWGHYPIAAFVFAAGRAGQCGFLGSLGAVPHHSALNRSAEAIYGRSRTLASDAGLLLVDTPLGKWWTPKGTGLSFLLAEQELDSYGKLVLPGAVVLDCGANIGTFTRKALELGAATVIAIEPSPRNVECLRRNFAAEIKAGRVVIRAEGVWDSQGVMEMATYEVSALDSLVMKSREEGPRAGAVKVPLTTIDAIVRETGLTSIGLIKMDIEGAEKKALLGAAQTIRKFHPRLAIATENLPDDQYRIPEAVSGLDSRYRLRCSYCEMLPGWRIRPGVVIFE